MENEEKIIPSSTDPIFESHCMQLHKKGVIIVLSCGLFDDPYIDDAYIASIDAFLNSLDRGSSSGRTLIMGVPNEASFEGEKCNRDEEARIRTAASIEAVDHVVPFQYYFVLMILVRPHIYLVTESFDELYQKDKLHLSALDMLGGKMCRLR